MGGRRAARGGNHTTHAGAGVEAAGAAVGHSGGWRRQNGGSVRGAAAATVRSGPSSWCSVDTVARVCGRRATGGHRRWQAESGTPVPGRRCGGGALRTVTFNQPMIAAASQADLDPDEVPVRLTLAIPGRWRWLSTDTLLFKAGADGARRPAYLRWRYARPNDQERLDPPGVRILNDILSIDGSPDTQTETDFHLRTLLGDAPGHLIVQVRAVSALKRLSDAQVRQLRGSPTATWIQATRLGLDLFVDRHQVLIWISRLSDGAPCAGVSVEPSAADACGVSDVTGVTRLPLPGGERGLVVARAGDDAAFLPVEATPPRDDAEDDGTRVTTDASRLVRSGQPACPLRDARGTDQVAPSRGEAAHREEPRSEQDHDVRISAFSDRTLYYPGGTLDAHTERHAHRILVQDIRRHECEVAVNVSLVLDCAVATVTAACGNGGPLAAAEVEWSVTATADHFRPSGSTEREVRRSPLAGFTFGVVPPWWLVDDDRCDEQDADDFRLRRGRGGAGPPTQRCGQDRVSFPNRRRRLPPVAHRLRVRRRYLPGAHRRHGNRIRPQAEGGEPLRPSAGPRRPLCRPAHHRQLRAAW